jgi:FtsH-binding integral membrane protein
MSMGMSIAQSWRPRHAWFFTASALLISVLFAGAVFAFAVPFPSFFGFLHEPAVKSVITILGFFLIFGVSLFFSKVSSPADFTAAFGFTRPREQEILLAVAVGLLI